MTRASSRSLRSALFFRRSVAVLASLAASLAGTIASAQTLAPVPTGFTTPGAAPAFVPPSQPTPPAAAMGYVQPAPSGWGQPAQGSSFQPSYGYSPSIDAPVAAVPVPEADKAKPPRDAADGPAVDAALVSQLPLMIGGQATFELPYRILLQGELGALPPAYINALDSVLVSTGTYDSTTSSLVRNGLKNSLVARVSMGFRPFAKHGFEIMGGYTLASLGGGISTRDAVAAAAGVSLPATIPDGDVQVKTTIHNVHASLGWRWVIADHLVIRASLAYLQSVGSSSRVEVPAQVAAIPEVSSRLPQINQALDARLDDTYSKYGKMPVLGLSLGYRF